MKALMVSMMMVAGALLAGCSTGAKVQTAYQLSEGDKLKVKVSTPAEAKDEGMKIFRDRLDAQLAAKGLLAKSSDGSARTLDVTMTNYRMRHGAARGLAGIFAGTDNIQSTVKVRDGAKVLSEFTVESKNATAWGTSRGMIEDHADQIVTTLQAGKR